MPSLNQVPELFILFWPLGRAYLSASAENTCLRHSGYLAALGYLSRGYLSSWGTCPLVATWPPGILVPRIL
eukprot:11338080-Karenia_brevis.AAC.1